MYHYPCTLERVVDGDTVDVIIDLGFSIHVCKRIRLARINAPESRTRNLEEKAAGIRATAWLTEKVEGASLSVKTELEGGKYGRVIGVLYANDVELNSLMVEEGYAWVYGAPKDLSVLK